MDENVLERIKARLLSGIKVNDSDFNFMKLNANLFKNIKFVKKRKAKKNGRHPNLRWRNNNNVACGKGLSRNKATTGRIFKSFSNQGYSRKEIITGTERTDTRTIEAIRRRDWIYFNRD